MQTIELTGEEFAELPNYSCTVPTGVIPGKRWKRAKEYDDQDMTRVDKWLVGEYQEDGSIVWYDIQISITVQEVITRYLTEKLEGYEKRITNAWEALRQGPPLEILLEVVDYKIFIKSDAVHILKKRAWAGTMDYEPLVKFPLDQVNLLEQLDEWLGRNLKEPLYE